jgi:hypothetical protein
MPIIAMDLLRPGRNNPDEEDRIGVKLWMHSMYHWTRILGVRSIGISYDSCNAAVAIDPRPGLYDTNDQFSIIYGSSRLYKGLDPDFNALANITEFSCSPFSNSLAGEHAEQSAIRAAVGSGIPLWDHNGHHHVYVDFNPCENCEPWLVNRPENWYVHFYTWMDLQEIAYNFKRERRRDDFGTYNEPARKKRRLE